MLNRRQMFMLGGISAGVVAMPKLLSSQSASAGSTAVASPLVYTPFSSPMPVPPVLRPSRPGRVLNDARRDNRFPFGNDYQLDITQATAELLPGYQASVMTYGGSFVGPVIQAVAGAPTTVTFRNLLAVPTNVHLHGGHVRAADDGHPMDLIQPGESRTYHYPNEQRAATLWYHAHPHGTEAEHVYQGLHGFYLISEPMERLLGLPDGDYDVPIMIRDGRFDSQGNLQHAFGPTLTSYMLVNGKAQPYFQVEARKYRLRLLNSSNGLVLQMGIGGATLTQIASDGGFLPSPVQRTDLRISSGERAEVVVDFAQFPVGSQVMLTDTVKGNLLRFDVVPARIPDHSRIPDQLALASALPASTVERDVVFRMVFTPGKNPIALVNDKPFDVDRVDFTITRGTTETWNLVNADANMNHNFHMHLTQFRVLERNGGAVPVGLDDAGWKDTVYLPPGGRAKVQARFADFLGRYMYHCHFLEHSAVGMMAQMEIVP
jgi:FtsP/CotA-like multicopper oxidase with cupredoxin domain